MGDDGAMTFDELVRYANQRGVRAKPTPPAVMHRLSTTLGAPPPEGVYACLCGAPLPRPGACAGCVAARDEEERRAALRLAFASVPALFRDAAFVDGSGQAVRVREVEGDGKMGGFIGINVADPIAYRAAREVDPLTESIILMPDREDERTAGNGKTLLAVCVFHALLERAIRDASVFDRVGYCRFIRARYLTPPEDADEEGRAKHLLAVRDAKKARVVVLDDVGQELLGAPSQTALAAQRRRAIVEIMQARFERALPTIITTAIADTNLFDEHYNGGGIGRRIYNNEGARKVRTIVVRSADRIARLKAERSGRR